IPPDKLPLPKLRGKGAEELSNKKPSRPFEWHEACGSKASAVSRTPYHKPYHNTSPYHQANAHPDTSGHWRGAGGEKKKRPIRSVFLSNKPTKLTHIQ
ncbi:hypothetical protein, partial [Flavobacterium sp. BFFFF1]|uniref:hypothetical protein n=1 Tax=Flavobacterium sp. BFFFF1 TaxID=2015557 RepID=UPI0025C20096